MILLKTDEGQEVEISEGSFVYWHTSDGNAGCPDWEELSQESRQQLSNLTEAVHEIMNVMPVWLE